MRTTLALIALFMAADLHAAQWKQTLVIDDHTIAIHLDELNKARFPSLGNGRDGAIDSAPLDVTMAADPASYTVDGKHPAAVGRKTRPHTFVRADWTEQHALEHLIYLATRPAAGAGQTGHDQPECSRCSAAARPLSS